MLATGKVGDEVTEEQGYECARQCALNALAAIKAEIGELSQIKRVVKVVGLRRLDARLHRPAAGRQRRLRAARRGVRRRRQARPVGGRRRVLPLDAPVEVELVVEVVERDAADPAAGRAGRAGPRRTPTGELTPAEPRNAATVVLLRPGTTATVRRSTCCGGRRRWPSPPACASSRAAASTRATSTTRWPGPGRRRPTWAERLGTDEATARALVCAAVRETFEESGVLLAGPRRDVGGRRHHRRRLGGRPGRPGGARAVVHRLPRPARAGAAHRPARRVVRLADAGLRAAALPHLVLRRRAARGAAHPRRVDGVVVGDLDAARWTPRRRSTRASC